MLNTSESIMNLIEGTLLEGQKVFQLEIPESSNFAFAIQVDSGKDIAAWNLMRSHLELTRRYPVLVYPWSSYLNGWEQDVTEEDFFSRWSYRQELCNSEHQNTSPETIISRVLQVELDNFLENPPTFEEDDLDREVDYALEETEKRFGHSPKKSEIGVLIQDGIITSQMELEKWLFHWELQNFNRKQALTPSNLSYLDWFEPCSAKILMLLPTINGWDSLAYLHWYGAGNAGSEVAISFLKRWHQSHNAELMCHYGTMLQFTVGQPPKSPTAAFELAWEQYALAPCTLQSPGISLRDHARS